MTTRSVPTTSPQVTDRTRALLACGVLAGPVFVGTSTVQVLTRDGFDLSRQPISLLSLGDHGWIQVATFVVAGVLSLAFAVGARQVLRSGPASTWGPRLLAVYGVGLVAGGVFLPDPGLGFPPGTPDRIPDDLSWHGILHAVAPPLANLGLVLACLVFARRFSAGGQRALARFSVATGAACLVLAGWPGIDGAGVRLYVACVLAFAWLTALAVRLGGEYLSRSWAGSGATSD